MIDTRTAEMDEMTKARVEHVAKALCDAEIAPGTWPCDVGHYTHMAEAALAALAAQSAAPVGEDISKDSTCYVERSMVRVAVMGTGDEALLKYVDSLPIFVAADFLSPDWKQDQAETSRLAGKD